MTLIKFFKRLASALDLLQPFGDTAHSKEQQLSNIGAKCGALVVIALLVSLRVKLDGVRGRP
jgi:hypothetical protein